MNCSGGWRGRPTSYIAALHATRLLRPQILDAKRESRKIDTNWFSTGILGDVASARHGDVECVCFNSDDVGRSYFTVKLTGGKPSFITSVEQPFRVFVDCPKPELGLSE